ncbi:replication protein A 32 kDa subunit [Chelonus insularis]|uniref:replication protein A 32 kDa subunit n=1 Tax=Chelonus insularis TaxID=460826 RepID=UPI00158D046E|nr:replication protein A 32 kDa subunit [Chelonus insularis]
MWNSGKNEGGFMDESYSTSAPQEKTTKDARRGANIIPMMIGNVKKCTRKSKTIWGANINIICVVGIVQEISEVTTKIAYELEDETGTISAFKWLEAESTAPDDIKIGSYAKVHGSVREQGDKVHIFVMKITPVKYFSEIFSHLLEVTMIAMKSHTSNAMEGIEEQGTNDDDDDNVCLGLTNEQKIIYRIIKQHSDSEAGIERSELKQKVPSPLLSKVDGILDFLSSEGHVYTTRTDDHYKAT